MDSGHLPLRLAIEQGRLEDFIHQEEARGVGSVISSDFDAVIGVVVTPPQSADQTSHSPSHDGSTGK
jgi:hypothetical protein